MRIVHLMLSRSPQTGKRYYNTVIGLAALGEEPAVITHPRAPINDRLKELPFSQLALRAPLGERDRRAAAALGPLVRTLRAEILLCYDPVALALARQALGASLPIIAVDDGADDWPAGADAVLVLTRSRMSALEQAGMAAERLFHVPPMTDAPGGFIRPLWKQPPQVFVHASLEEKGGIAVFLEALCRLREEAVECRATILGEGLRLWKFQRLLRQLKLEETVRFQPAPSDMTSFLQEADLFCHPALEDLDSAVFLPAMAGKLPIVATSTEAAKEMLTDGEEALLCAPGDAAALADALKHMLRDEDAARTRASNAFHRMRRHHTRERVFRYLQEVVHYVAQAHALGQPLEAPETLVA